MPAIKKIATNSTTWFIGQILNKVLGLILVIYAARKLGEEGFGRYTVVMAYYVIVNVIIDFGLRPLIIREVARNREQANSFLFSSLIIKTVIHIGSLLILFPLLHITSTPFETSYATILAILALLPFTYSQTLSSLYMALERMYYEAFIVTLGQFLWVVTVIGLLASGYSLISIFKALIFLNTIIFTVNYIIFTKRFFKPKFTFDWQLIKKMLHKALPFAMTSAFAILYFRIDTIMLAMIKGELEVSWYGVAYRFTDAVQFLPISLMVSLYPILSRLFLRNQETMQVLVEKSYYYLFVIGLPIAAGLSLSAEKIIKLFFHNTYMESISVLIILSWALLPLFLNSVLITTMNSSNRQHRVTRATLISLFANIAGNIILIPLLGVYGACLTTILSECIIVFILKHEITRDLNFTFPKLSSLYAPIIATLAMVIFFNYFYLWSLGILIFSSIFTFFLVLLVSRGIHLKDLKLFKKALLEKEVK